MKLGLEPCLVCKPTTSGTEEHSHLIGDAEEEIVYMTKTGTRYHTSGHYSSSVGIALSEALKLGLEPCSICKPSSNGNSDTPNSLITSPTQKSTSAQCHGITKAGQRCKRMTTEPSGYCYQHKD
jgi:hypothetical protein